MNPNRLPEQKSCARNGQAGVSLSAAENLFLDPCGLVPRLTYFSVVSIGRLPKGYKYTSNVRQSGRHRRQCVFILLFFFFITFLSIGVSGKVCVCLCSVREEENVVCVCFFIFFIIIYYIFQYLFFFFIGFINNIT